MRKSYGILFLFSAHEPFLYVCLNEKAIIDIVALRVGTLYCTIN